MADRSMPLKKKRITLEKFFIPTSGSSSVSTSTDSEESHVKSNDSKRHQRKFLMDWKLIFTWVEMEDGNHKKLYCRECCSANLKNPFAVGKARPLGGWKKEYLQQHAISNDHVKYASEEFRKIRLKSSMMIKFLSEFRPRKRQHWG